MIDPLLKRTSSSYDAAGRRLRDVSGQSGEDLFELRLHPVCNRVALTDHCARRHGDHDVSERASGGLAEAKPRE